MKWIRRCCLLSAVMISAFSSFAQTYAYYFNGNFNEASAGPALSEVLSCGAVTGSFTTQIISTTAGSCSALAQPVFAFNAGGGLSFPNNSTIGGTYTIHMFFKFNALGGYQRIIDFLDGITDAGLYTLGNCLNFYPNGNVGTCSFMANTFFLLTLVRDGVTNVITIYLNGASFGTFNDAASTYVPATSTTPIVFFRDNIGASPAQCEDQSGSIKYLSVSPTLSTPADVYNTWTSICSIALPLQITSFAGHKENNTVLLSWQTQNEMNVSHFEIERSINGNSFQVINNVQAANSPLPNSYYFTDPYPMPGVSYYRIKMVDRDGQFRYTSTIKINFLGITVMQVYPNPAKDEIVIAGINSNGMIKLLSPDGRVLLQQSAAGQSMTLSISGLPQGVYIVEYNDGKNTQRQKLIKN